ncbi:site-specific integrase [Micromonospora sp. NPDC023633]|uniref:site-specific integrase n=1 Tax=Micromonospora sp. NPDC023633 TaxID=3154320 RepID=UPI0033E7AA43
MHEKLTGLKAKAQAGIRVAGSIQSVADFMAYWQREVLQDRVRPSTLRTYRAKSTCQCCAQGKDAARRAAGKEARCCAKHPRQCCESYPSDGTIRHLHRMIRAALQDAVVDGLIAENPARNLRLAHRYRPRFTPLTGEEAKLLLKAARSDRLYALYAVALALGLRRGEALALRWQDVDLVDGVLFVRQSLQRLNGRLVFGPVKSDESERVIGLPPPCLAALRQHKLMQDAERKTTGRQVAGLRPDLHHRHRNANRAAQPQPALRLAPRRCRATSSALP